MHRNSPGHSCTSHSIPNPTHITEPITSPLTPRCHCWGLFIITAAGDATGKPQPWARGMKDGEEEKGAQQHKADPKPKVGWGAAPGSAWPVSLSHIPSRLGSFGAFLWLLEQVLGAQLSPHAAAPLTHPLLLFQPGRMARGTSAGTGGGCPAGWTLPWPAGSTWPPSSPAGGSLAASARGTTTTGH